jgi:hypothetical protein
MVAVAGGGALVADFDARWSSPPLGPALIVVSLAGVFITVPETKEALPVLGAALSLLLIGWPVNLASLGAGGSFAATGLLAWTTAQGGRSETPPSWVDWPASACWWPNYSVVVPTRTARAVASPARFVRAPPRPRTAPQGPRSQGLAASDGSLVIERTEALTVVDVNTGRNVGCINLEETVYRNNLEAAEEIARQLRPRDVGGIIVIDFIDMETKANRDDLMRVFREALSRDKTRTQVFEVSELGLVQMTRRRIGEGLLEALSGPCPTCDGRGMVFDPDP